MLRIQGPEYIVIGPILPFDYTIYIYNIRVHEANVIVPFHQHACIFILHDTKQKRKHRLSSAIIQKLEETHA